MFWFRPGEQLLCEASTVLKYVQEDACQRGICGRLVCTDFKIAFLGSDESALESDVCPSAFGWVWGSSAAAAPLSLPQLLGYSTPMHTSTKEKSALCPSGSPSSVGPF